MNILNKTVLYTTLILVIGLFQGCSGHALQDLIDGNTNDSPSDKAEHLDTNSHTVTPSQNKALNSISPSTTASDEHEEYRYMQKNTNAWIEKEWEPLTESNTSIQKEKQAAIKTDNNITKTDTNESVSKDDNSSSGLQYYVDKAELYFENKEKRDANKTKAPSHVDTINAMPGIGKPDKEH